MWWQQTAVLRARWTLLAALGLLAVGAFLELTSELTEGDLDALDRAVLSRIVLLRTRGLNAAALDVTALGSVTVLSLVVATAVLLFAIVRDVQSLAQLTIAALGGAACSNLLKRLVERERPAVVPSLVEVAGYSYPSGHALASASIYLTLAILAWRRLPRGPGRAVLVALALLVALAVGVSRAYIGVHYPSDVLAGLLLGSGWALLVSAVFSFARRRRSPSRRGAVDAACPEPPGSA